PTGADHHQVQTGALLLQLGTQILRLIQRVQGDNPLPGGRTNRYRPRGQHHLIGRVRGAVGHPYLGARPEAQLLGPHPEVNLIGHFQIVSQVLTEPDRGGVGEQLLGPRRTVVRRGELPAHEPDMAGEAGGAQFCDGTQTGQSGPDDENAIRNRMRRHGSTLLPVKSGSMSGPNPTASEQRGTYLAMWLSLAGVAGAVVVTFVVGPRVGSLVLAAELVLIGLLRAVLPKAPYGISARSRGFDATVLIAAGLAMGAFALTAQNM